MNVVKRSFLFVMRQRRKSILLFIILFVMTFLVLNSLTIYQTVYDTTRDLRERLGGNFQINSKERKSLVNDEMIEKVMKEVQVKDYNGLNISYLYAEELILEPGSFAGTGEYQEFMPRFLANNKSELFEFFQTNAFELVSGNHIYPEDKGKALISENIAEYNQLAVGDKFTTAMFEFEDKTGEDVPTGQQFTFEIAGIYKINSNRKFSGISPECDLWENYIIIDSFSGKEMNSIMAGQESSYYNSGVTFFVRDPKEMQITIERLQNRVDLNWSRLSITKNDTIYQNSAGPLEKIEGIIILLIIAILVFSILLLSLVLAIWMKERIREIGIFLSIGISKRGIIGQFLLECIIAFVLALCLTGAVSKITTEAWGSSMLKQVAQKDMRENDIGSDTVDNYVKDNLSLTVTTDINDFLIVLLIGSGVIIISVGLSSIKILKMEPKNILTSIS